MRVNTKSGWFKLSVVLVSIALVYVSCNFRPIFLKPKFTVWQPKQLEYTGELVEKWSFDLPSTGCVKGIIRKDSWKFEQKGKNYFINSKGIKRDLLGKGIGLDDANSQARVEKLLGLFSYFDNSWNILSFWSKYYYVRNYIAKDDYIIVVEGNLYGIIRKIDINSGKTLWTKEISIDGLHLMPNFYIVGDKVAINTFHNVTFDDDRESELEDNAYLLDLEDGKMELVNVPGSVKCVGYKDQLYLIINNNKVVKYDIKSKSLVGKLFDITKKIENGCSMIQQNISWFKFLDNKNHYENFLLNPNTMDICQSNVSFSDDWDYLYNDYFLACMRKNGKIVGIDTQSFKETWFISTNKLSEYSKVILGDERGILVQSNDKLICFGPP